jgi:hypothetical protein
MGILTAALFCSIATAAAPLPEAKGPAALECLHFPSRMHTFIWRNWPVVAEERLASVLGTTSQNVRQVAESMGLPPQGTILPQWKDRGYLTVLRRNWHLLPYEQLLTILGMSADELAYSLREDDFLSAKLGQKPQCDRLAWAPPDAAAQRRAAEIRRLIEQTFGAELQRPEEPRFAFVDRLSRVTRAYSPRPLAGEGTETASRLAPPQGPHFIYSYFALYGDPLARPELDPYPDGLLEKLAAAGVNGIWLHTVLRTLAPSKTFPEFGAGHEKRLENLRQLVARAKRRGIDVYLYMNEPRAMPEAFFQGRPELRGVQEGDHWALCTSQQAVRDWLSDSLAYVFQRVPELGGIFTITASENLTNCASHGQYKRCPHCQHRTAAEIIAEVNAAMEAGVHRGNPQAKVIVWDWGWADAWAPEVIARLPKSVWLQSVSEWSLPIVRGGVASAVGEYSLSAVGPGPRAVGHWEAARRAGLKTVAKVQLNNSWELSTVPYLPVLDLVAEHARNLAQAKVDGMMLGWSLGGYPSPNLEVAHEFAIDPQAKQEDVLERVAQRHFGPAGASHARRAWSIFSQAFREYPFHIRVLYQSPVQVGPANPLYPSPTGYHATMTGIAYDDLQAWRGPYEPEVFAGQFAKVAEAWRPGLDELGQAVSSTPANLAGDARAELCFARAAYWHFLSVANQARFTAARSALSAASNTPSQRLALVSAMKQAIAAELQAAGALWRVARENSCIGYEAANQYFYLPIDLLEKVVSCQYLMESLPSGSL